MAVSFQQLTQLYLAYFGRPPDFDGVQFYTSNPNETLESVTAKFSASPEAVRLYGGTFGVSQINQIYRNLFNRDAEPAALLYWSQEVGSGRISASMVAYAILVGAQNADAVTIQNKITISTAFFNALDTTAEITGYSGDAAAASARDFLSTVTSDAATVTAAQANLDAEVAEAVAAGGGGGAVGATLTLTSGTDLADTTSASRSGLASDFRFTSANEVINAGVGTLSAADVLLDSTTTDNDVLNATLVGASGAFTAQNIETINVTFSNAAANLELDQVAGVKTVGVTGTTAGAVTGFNAQTTQPTISIANYTNTVTLAPTDLSGTAAASNAETLNLKVSGVSYGTTAATRSVVLIDAQTTGGGDVDGILETLNITSSGSAANTFELTFDAGDSVGTINISGDQDLTLRVAHADITGVTVNASSNTKTTTLSVDRDNATTATTNFANVTGVEALAFREDDGSDALVATNVEAGTAILATADFATGSVITVRGAASNTADSLKLTLDNTTADTDVDFAGTLNIQNVETIEIVSTGVAGAATDASKVNSVTTLQGDFSTVKLTGDAHITVGFTHDGAATADTVSTVDASGLTGTATANISVTAATNVLYKIVGSANADTIAGSANKDTIEAGAGADVITMSDGDDVITLGAGVDRLDFGNIAGNLAGLNEGAGSLIKDFAAGTGGDVFDLDNATLVAALGTAGYFETAAGTGVTDDDHTVIVLAHAGFDNVNAAEDYIAGLVADATTTDVVFVYYDNSLGYARVAYDTSIGVDNAITDASVIANLENIVNLTGVAALSAANFDFTT